MVSAPHADFLTADQKQRDFAKTLLKTCAIVVDNYLAMVSAHVKELKEDESSFCNYASIENCLGLSHTLFGRTGSSYRYEAARHVLSDALDARAGIEILQASIDLGYLPQHNKQVQKFTNGPFGTLIDINNVLSGKTQSHTPTAQEAYQLTWRFAASLVSLCNKYESEELAIESAFFMSGQLTDEDVVRLLPDMFTYTYEMIGRRVVNSVFNLPSIAMMALTGPGRLLASVPKVRAAVQAGTTAMGPLRYALPGVSYFRVGQEAAYVTRLHHIVTNITFELIKGSIYAGVGNKVGGDGGATVGLMAYMGGAWLHAGYVQQLSMLMAREVIAGEAGGMVGAWIKRGMSHSDQLFLADDIAQVQHMRSFRLTPLGNAAENYGMISGIRTQLQTDAELAALHAREAEAAAIKAAEAAQRLANELRRLDTPIRRATELAPKLPGSQGDELLAAIQQIRSSVTAPGGVGDAKRAIETLIETAKKSAREAARAAKEALAAQNPVLREATPRRVVTATQPVEVVPKDPHMSRADRMASYEGPTPPEGTPAATGNTPPQGNAAVTPSNGTTTIASPRLTEFADRLLKNLPETLDRQVIQRLVDDVVIFEGNTMDDIQRLYATQQGSRQAIIRRLNEIPRIYSNQLVDGRNWKFLGDNDHVRGKIGQYYRIFVSRNGSGLRIYKFEARGSLDGNGPWK